MTDRQARGLERLTFFSDAVFAIAMTLLVIEIRLPHLEPATDRALADALAALEPNFIGFLVSFLVVARFWTGHHRIMNMLGAAPPRLVRANVALLLAVAFMPFPTAVLSDYVALRGAALFYSGWLVLTGLANMNLVRAAFADPALLRADVGADEVARVRRTRWFPVAAGLAAAAASLVAPRLVVAALTLAAVTLAVIEARRRRS